MIKALTKKFTKLFNMLNDINPTMYDEAMQRD